MLYEIGNFWRPALRENKQMFDGTPQPQRNLWLQMYHYKRVSMLNWIKQYWMISQGTVLSPLGHVISGVSQFDDELMVEINYLFALSLSVRAARNGRACWILIMSTLVCTFRSWFVLSSVTQGKFLAFIDWCRSRQCFYVWQSADWLTNIIR